jgi:hypothetical protein
VRELSYGGIGNGFEHAPGSVLQRRVARDTVKDEYGLYSLGAASQKKTIVS